MDFLGRVHRDCLRPETTVLAFYLCIVWPSAQCTGKSCMFAEFNLSFPSCVPCCYHMCLSCSPFSVHLWNMFVLWTLASSGLVYPTDILRLALKHQHKYLDRDLNSLGTGRGLECKEENHKVFDETFLYSLSFMLICIDSVPGTVTADGSIVEDITKSLPTLKELIS